SVVSPRKPPPCEGRQGEGGRGLQLRATFPDAGVYGTDSPANSCRATNPPSPGLAVHTTAGCRFMAKVINPHVENACPKDLGRSPRPLLRGRARPPIRRSPSDPRGHHTASLRVASHGRPAGAPPRPDGRDDGPQHTDAWRPRCRGRGRQATAGRPRG